MAAVPTDATARATGPRRWLQFGLRGLLVAGVVVAILCAPLGWEFSRLRRQQQAIDRVAQLQGAAFLNNHDRHQPPAWWLGTMRRLLGRDFLAHVDEVYFGPPSTELQDDDLKILSQFPKLRGVDIYHGPVGDAVLETLAGLPRLERLGFEPGNLSPRGYAHLGSIATLKRLYLEGHLANDSLHHLAGLGQLEYLDLADTNLNDQGLAHLARLPRLHWLDLAGTQVTDLGIPHLARMESLVQLDLCDTGVTDEGVDGLAALPRLRVVLLGPPVTPAAARRLHSLLPDGCEVHLLRDDGSVLQLP